MIPLVWILFVSVAVGAAAAILAWRQRPEPGAAPLVALLVGQSWWSTCIIFGLRGGTVESRLVWTNFAWVGVVAIPVAWLLFALEYTGRDEYVRRRYVAALSVVPVLTVLLAATGRFHDLLFIRSAGVWVDGVLQVAHGGPWYAVIAGYTYLLGGAGMVLVLGVLTSDAATFRSQGAALLVGLLAPWITNALYLTDVLPTSGIDPTPIAFSVSGVAYLSAISRYRLFGTNPAPRVRARQLIFDRMQEGALVVDTNDRVVEVNDSCVDILGAEASDVLGAPAAEVIPEYDRLPEEGALSGHLTVGDAPGDRPYDVTVTRINNVRDKTIGRVISLHDVSKHLRQQQRLEVLNRILRHNIRTETNVIHGYVDRFADDENAQIVKRRALRIEELGRKGREAIELFDEGREGQDPTSLDSLLERCVDAAREEYPHAAVTYDPPETDFPVAGLLRTVVSNLVENAVEHNSGETPGVWISARRVEGRARVRIADDGPGIDAYELRVLEDGVETALQHGSGLGLWIAKWGAEIAGGTVRFEETDADGAVVVVEVPVLADPTAED